MVKIKKLFGHFNPFANVGHKERKKLKKERTAFESERNAFRAQRPQAEREDEQDMERQAKVKAKEAKETRLAGRAEGEKYGTEFFNQDMQGLTPEQRRNSQYESDQRINRDLYAKEKKLLGEHGKRNIGNKSGVAFAQQQELKRDAEEARGQASRDLDNVNADLRMKKLAAVFASGKGEEAQSLLDNQTAADELDLKRERKRARHDEQEYKNNFMKRL
jgi:hypothetical protein